MNTPIYRRTKGTQPIQNPYNFQPAAPFGGQKRESGNAVSKVCPHRDAQGFFKSRLIRVRKSLRAFDTARKLSQTPYAERCGGKVSGLYLSVGFSLGIVGVQYRFCTDSTHCKKDSPCGIMEAQTSRKVSYHGVRMFSDCGNKMRGSSRAQEIAPGVS